MNYKPAYNVYWSAERGQALFASFFSNLFVSVILVPNFYLMLPQKGSSRLTISASTSLSKKGCINFVTFLFWHDTAKCITWIFLLNRWNISNISFRFLQGNASKQIDAWLFHSLSNGHNNQTDLILFDDASSIA